MFTFKYIPIPMKTRLLKRSKAWASSGAASLAGISASDAAISVFDINHDLTTSLDSQAIFPDFSGGFQADAGQWQYAFVGTALPSSGGQGIIMTASAIDPSTAYPGLTAGVFNIGAFSLSSSNGSDYLTAIGLNDCRRGYLQWNLADGTEGWLRFIAQRNGDENETSPSTRPTLFATGFLYEDTDRFTRPDLASVEAAGGANEVFTDHSLSSVPEPSSLMLLACGAAGVTTRRRRKQAA